jgi:hypothetical protein
MSLSGASSSIIFRLPAQILLSSSGNTRPVSFLLATVALTQLSCTLQVGAGHKDHKLVAYKQLMLQRKDCEVM